MENSYHQIALIRTIDDLPTRAVYNNNPDWVRYDFKDGRMPSNVHIFQSDPLYAVVTDDVRELTRYIVLRAMYLYEQENRHASLFTLHLATKGGDVRRNSRSHHAYASFNPINESPFSIGMRPDEGGMGKLFTDLDKWLRTVTHEQWVCDVVVPRCIGLLAHRSKYDGRGHLLETVYGGKFE